MGLGRPRTFLSRNSSKIRLSCPKKVNIRVFDSYINIKFFESLENRAFFYGEMSKFLVLLLSTFE